MANKRIQQMPLLEITESLENWGLTSSKSIFHVNQHIGNFFTEIFTYIKRLRTRVVDNF